MRPNHSEGQVSEVEFLPLIATGANISTINVQPVKYWKSYPEDLEINTPLSGTVNSTI